MVNCSERAILLVAMFFYTPEFAMKQNPQLLQDPFLQQLFEQEIEVNIYLSRGIKLEGLIAGFDPYVVMLAYEGVTQMVYKSQISTVVPVGRFSFKFPDGEAAITSRKGFLPLLQEPFLSQAMKERIVVAINLNNGVRKYRQLVSYDQYVVIVYDRQSQTTEMIYKSAIATFVPSTGFKFQREPVREAIAA